MTGGVVRHGHSLVGQRSPEHRAWTGMKQRCTNPNNPKFAQYGGRGIFVCERWLLSFVDFLADMGPRPDGHSLERKDNNGNYEPSNCVWATRVKQQRNRRVNKRVEFRGREITLFQAIEEAGQIVPYSTAYFRIEQGWETERAVTEPLHSVGRPRLANPVRKRISA